MNNISIRTLWTSLISSSSESWPNHISMACTLFSNPPKEDREWKGFYWDRGPVCNSKHPVTHSGGAAYQGEALLFDDTAQKTHPVTMGMGGATRLVFDDTAQKVESTFEINPKQDILINIQLHPPSVICWVSSLPSKWGSAFRAWSTWNHRVTSVSLAAPRHTSRILSET